LIIYQDVTDAVKANAALQQATLSPNVYVEWSIRPWPVNMLKFPPAAAEALADATDAHLIVFAGGCVRSSSYCLQDWLEQWAGRRQIQTAALAIIDTRGVDKLSRSVASDLYQFANRHGLSMICDDPSVAEHGEPFSTRVLLDPAQSKPLILTQPPDRQTYDGYRRWGINE
jgi:hypothetical protein